MGSDLALLADRRLKNALEVVSVTERLCLFHNTNWWSS